LNCRINILLLIIILALTSCEKKLNLTKIENKEILIENYQISELTSIHQFLEITNKKWNKAERILEANDNTIDSIYMQQDTIFLRTTDKKPIIYDLAAIKFGYKIILTEPKTK